MAITKRPARSLAVWAVLVLVLASASWAQAPRNVILLIGDGMGFEQARAASLYAAGKEGALAFEKEFKGEMTTHSLDSYLKKIHATDSAAAATAMATGYKTKNGYLCVLPDGRELQTVLEVFAKAGKRTGLVTTVPMTHATPAGFGSHAKSRKDCKKIAADYFTRTRPNVLFGAYMKNGTGVTEQKAAGAGYEVVKTREQMKDLVARATEAAAKGKPVYVSGQFAPDQMPWEYAGPVEEKIVGYEDEDDDGGDDPRNAVMFETAPHLSEMAEAALALLDGPKGFFLMVEGGSIDKAGHKNQIQRSVFETLEFEKAFRAVMAWAADRKDTLVIVTADHECGALWVVRSRGKGKFPDVFWGRTDHTGLNVPVYAWGPGADRLKGVIDNTGLYEVMTGVAPAPLPPAPPAAVPATRQPAAVLN